MKCKSCEGTEFQATHRNLMERIAFYAIPFHVFECQGCNEHRWGLRLKPEDKFQWLGHGATLLLLLALILLPMLLAAPQPEPEQNVAEDQATATQADAVPIDDAADDVASEADAEVPKTATPQVEASTQTGVASEQTDVASEQTDVASEQTDVASENEAAGEGLVASADPYRDQPQPSAFVREQAQRNGGSPPMISIDDDEEEPVSPTPDTSKPAATNAKIATKPPPKEPPKRKPSLQQLPQADVAGGIVASVRHGLSEPGSYSLLLQANQPFAAPRAAVTLADNRQYVDIPGAWQAGSGVANRLKVEGFPLDAIRFGFGQTRLRIVFDFTETMAKPEVSREGNQIRFILKAAP